MKKVILHTRTTEERSQQVAKIAEETCRSVSGLIDYCIQYTIKHDPTLMVTQKSISVNNGVSN